MDSDDNPFSDDGPNETESSDDSPIRLAKPSSGQIPITNFRKRKLPMPTLEKDTPMNMRDALDKISFLERRVESVNFNYARFSDKAEGVMKAQKREIEKLTKRIGRGKANRVRLLEKQCDTLMRRVEKREMENIQLKARNEELERENRSLKQNNKELSIAMRESMLTSPSANGIKPPRI